MLKKRGGGGPCDAIQLVLFKRNKGNVLFFTSAGQSSAVASRDRSQRQVCAMVTDGKSSALAQKPPTTLETFPNLVILDDALQLVILTK